MNCQIKVLDSRSKCLADLSGSCMSCAMVSVWCSGIGLTQEYMLMNTTEVLTFPSLGGFLVGPDSTVLLQDCAVATYLPLMYNVAFCVLFCVHCVVLDVTYMA